MNSRLPFYVLISALVITGISVALVRNSVLEIPFTPGETRPVWLIEARVDFVAQGRQVLLSFDLPEAMPGFRLLNEQAASPGYGFSIIDNDGDRRGEWSKRSARGPQTLYYKVQLVGDVDVNAVEDSSPPAVSDVFWDEPQATAASQILSQALATSSSPQSLARELIKLLRNPQPGQNAALLLASENNISQLLEKFLNQAGIPAHISMGLFLEDARRRQTLTPVVEISTDDGWVVIDPRTGDQGVPNNLFLWHRGSSSLLDVVGGSQSRVSFSMIRQTVPALNLAQTTFKEHPFAMLGIHRLPIEEQSMFKLLLLLPLGALVVVFMRIILGLKTSGTFMPILISLAFMQTSLLPGLISFVGIVGIGLVIRSYLSRLNLLLVARIATLVVLVIFLISLLSLLGYHLGLSTGMTITFFPMIIIAWTIERMSILWEEEGPREVALQGGGSLLVAVIAYLLMQVTLIKHLTFNFPEVNLIILALILMMGQYTGYKLSELRRFRAMLGIQQVSDFEQTADSEQRAISEPVTKAEPITKVEKAP